MGCQKSRVFIKMRGGVVILKAIYHLVLQPSGDPPPSVSASVVQRYDRLNQSLYGPAHPCAAEESSLVETRAARNTRRINQPLVRGKSACVRPPPCKRPKICPFHQPHNGGFRAPAEFPIPECSYGGHNQAGVFIYHFPPLLTTSSYRRLCDQRVGQP